MVITSYSPTDLTVRENGKLEIDAAWFNAIRTALLRGQIVKQISLTYADFTAAAVNEAVNAFSLTAGQIVEDVLLRPTTRWSGGSLTTFTLSFGTSADPAKYTPTPYDVFLSGAINGQTGYRDNHPSNIWDDYSAATQMQVKAIGSHNVNTATAGAALMWVFIRGMV